MTTKAGASVPPYGVAIHDALRDPKTSMEELIAHRDHARQVLAAQGDLQAALKRLDQEIARRSGH
jgi:hypothetical protein